MAEIKKFTFWKSWKDQAALLSAEDRLSFYDAIVTYAFDGTVPSKEAVSPMVYGFFIGVMPFIDSNIQNTLNGAKGGRPTARSGKSNNPPFNPPQKAEYENEYEFEFGNEYEYEKENVRENEEGEASPKTPSKNSPRFVPPKQEEVEAWLECEKQMPVRDAERLAEKFCRFYESKGWMVGRNRMKSWRAAVAGWIARDRQAAEAAAEATHGLCSSELPGQFQAGGNVKTFQTHENAPRIIEMQSVVL